MSTLSITWLGHSTFIITTPGGKRIVTDPWLEGNPACPADRKKIEAADLILLSHGHSDHSGDVVSVARATGAPVSAGFPEQAERQLRPPPPKSDSRSRKTLKTSRKIEAASNGAAWIWSARRRRWKSYIV